MRISIFFILTVLFLLQKSKVSLSYTCKESERQALIDFKQGIVDKTNKLSLWAGRDCCSWKGILCNNITGHVVKLDLRNTDHEPQPEDFDFLRPDYDALNMAYEKAYYAYWDAALKVVQVNPSLVDLKQLQYLDLSSSNFSSFKGIPDLFGLFHELRYLNLSNSMFDDYENPKFLPNWWQNLINLEILDLSTNFFGGPIPTSLAALPSLKKLHLQHNYYLNGSIFMFLSKKLEILDLSYNSFSGPIPASLGELSTLKELLLSHNRLNGSISTFLSKNLEILDLSSNSFSGPIPASLGSLLILERLELGLNSLSGRIPDSIGNLSNLTSLILSENQFTGEIPISLEKLTNLVYLDLSYNNLGGQIPTHLGTTATKLVKLYLESNQLNGTIPISLGQLSQLEALSLSHNSLSGDVTDMHFANLSKLSDLDISFNPLLVLKMRDGWVPPFNVHVLNLEGCHVGPHFPKWIQSQTKLKYLYMKDAGITDSIPEWLSHNMTQLEILVLSGNQIHGNVPDLHLSEGAQIFLGSNRFEGPFPNFIFNCTSLDLSNNSINGSLSDLKLTSVVTILFLSNNHITGSIPTSLCEFKTLQRIDLSKNHLSESLPQCLGNLINLDHLDLSSNNLSGSIPASFGHLYRLFLLSLSNNFFHGEIPSNMQNCTRLSILDLGENALSGEIPGWIGESLINLMILRLNRNMYSGGISPKLCSLDRLQILDLGHNNLSGIIPYCFGNFTTMVSGIRYNVESLGAKVSEEFNGGIREYIETLQYLANLDLSSNNLVGQIPDSISNISFLLGLNLAKNHFTGSIPHHIGNMSSLVSLDLSQNNLSGEIPPSISLLSKLSHLNLSNNHLSGAIPSGSQLQTLTDPSIYQGNNLCGFPLERKCIENKQPPPSTEINDREDEPDSKFFYFGLLSGFIVGMWIVFCIMLFKKTWRCTYFRLVDDIKTRLLVAVETRIARSRN